MLDFKKLMDPAFVAEMKLKREAEQAVIKAEDSRIHAALTLVADHLDELEAKERSFVYSAQSRFYQSSYLSDPQKKVVVRHSGAAYSCRQIDSLSGNLTTI